MVRLTLEQELENALKLEQAAKETQKKLREKIRKKEEKFAQKIAKAFMKNYKTTDYEELKKKIFIEELSNIILEETDITGKAILERFTEAQPKITKETSRAQLTSEKSTEAQPILDENSQAQVEVIEVTEAQPLVLDLEYIQESLKDVFIKYRISAITQTAIKRKIQEYQTKESQQLEELQSILDLEITQDKLILAPIKPNIINQIEEVLKNAMKQGEGK